jgi:GDP-L-fucose synthase
MEYGGLEKFVCISTICVYPAIPPRIPFKEDDIWCELPEISNLPYGISKRSLDVMCRAYRKQYGMNCIYLMLTNNFGEFDSFDFETAHVIPMLIRRFIEAKEREFPQVKVWGTGLASREFLYAGDCAQAIVLATEEYNSPEPMNIGSGQEIKIADLAKLIAELVGYEGKIEFDASMPDGQPRRFLDVSRAEKELGWKATTPLKEGLERTINWYLRNRSE